MSASALPTQLNYADRPSSLPDGTSMLSAVIAPSNGADFKENSIVQFDLPARDYLVPSSMYIRYKCEVKSTAVAHMRGIPVYTPFIRSECVIGSQIVESIADYGVVCNTLVNTKLNHATKAGMAYGFGLVGHTDEITNDNLDGRVLEGTTGETWSMAAPLGNLLSNSEMLIPLGMMGGTRVQLTLDTISNMFSNGNDVTEIKLSQVELCIDLVSFGGEVDAIVGSMADEEGNIIIKSQSYNTTTQTPPLFAGTQEMVFNQRLSSIKSIVALMGRSKAGCNGKYDSVDISNKGNYQFTIASVPYPPRPLNADCKAGIFMEMSNAWGVAHDLNSSQNSISPFAYSALVDGPDTGVSSPGKFIVAVNTERLSTSALLTGVSSQLSPITFRIFRAGDPYVESSSITLVTLFDALIIVNVASRQVSVKI